MKILLIVLAVMAVLIALFHHSVDSRGVTLLAVVIAGAGVLVAFAGGYGGFVKTLSVVVGGLLVLAATGNVHFYFYAGSSDAGSQMEEGGPLFYGETAWSPDGTRIAFISNRDGNPNIDLINPDGSGQETLTRSAADDASPAWSPDGRRIAFESTRDGNPEIYVMNRDGSAQHPLTRNPAEDAFPAWSPDGRRIAFESTRDGNAEIYVMNADGSNPHRLTRSPYVDTNPAWSPDGRRIAFEHDAAVAAVYVMNLDGSHQHRLTPNTSNSTQPAWSPDGRTISFDSDRNGNWDVYLMNADGRHQRQLTSNPADDGPTSWSPEGRTIAFDTGSNGNYQIDLMNADGSNQRLLTASAGYAAHAHGSGAPPRPVRDATSKAWYVADSCTWTAEDRRNCRTVLTFLAAFDLGRVNVACRQLSGRYLAQRNIGGLEGCAAYLRRHGANRRIEYSIISSRTRPDGGEVIYSINPPRRRNVERRYVAITIVEHGVTKIDALTAVDY